MSARDVMANQLVSTRGVDAVRVADNLLDALKANGYAVVELPKPIYGPDGEGQYGFPSPVSSVCSRPGSVWEEDFDMTPDDARDNAAALLAAADAAEREAGQ